MASGDDAEARPLSMCVGDLGGTESIEFRRSSGVGKNDGGDVAIYVCDGHYLVDGGSDRDISPGGEQWTFEGQHDLLDVDEMRELQNMFVSQVTDLYWAIRRVVRRVRVANDRFGPRRRFKGHLFKRHFRRKGFSARFCDKSRNMFFT